MNALATQSLDALPPAVRDERILAICDRAIGNLNDARDIETVVRLRDHAEMFAIYTRKMKAALHAQNECHLVVMLAEARIGAELKAAQERGEVAKAGDNPNVRASDNQKAALPQLGISRQRASEMKRMAEAGEARIRDEVAEANIEGRKPSRTNIVQPRPRYEPAYAQRAVEHAQFLLWLRTGAELAARIPDAAQFRTALDVAGERIPSAQVKAVINLLSWFEGEA